uniref:Uncharacterized protein n=1 Tax=Cannabis sativa TaxID=3483 RepID=A0A803QUD9_CANSA
MIFNGFRSAWGVISEVLVSGDTVIAEGPSLSGITHASSIRRCRLYIHGLPQVTDYNKFHDDKSYINEEIKKIQDEWTFL